MKTRKTTLAALALTATVAAAGSAQAATLTLDLDPSQTGPYAQIDTHTYFVPRSGHVSLRGTTLDDAGAPGNSCIRRFTRPLEGPDFTVDGGVSCPTDSGDGSGRWNWDVHPVENAQYKAAVVPDGSNRAAESNVVTLFTAPELFWSVGFDGSKPAIQFLVTSDSDAYDGTLVVRQRGRFVKAIHVSGDGTSEAHVRVAPKRRARALRRGGTFTAILTPTDQSRWTALYAAGVAKRGRTGDGSPVL
jgi:hypothetical protein